MKKALIALGLTALLAGCASHNNGMGGTSDQSSDSTGQYNNTPTQDNGAMSATNNAAGKSLQEQ